MTITLHAMSGSPFSWKCQLALEFKGLAYEMRWLSVDRGDLKAPELAALNPRNLVPVLTDGAITLYESEAIMRYLEAAYPEPTLFPGDLASKARGFRLVAEFDNHFGPSMEDLVREVLFKPDASQRDEQKLQAGRDKLRAELERLESEVRGDFLLGPLSAADFSYYPGIMLALRIDKRLPTLGIASMLGERLQGWMKRIEALPYYDRTYPPHWRT